MSPKSILEPADISVAVSAVIFAIRLGQNGSEPSNANEAGPCARLLIPLVRRTREPHLHQWALPGGWVGQDESLEAASGRALAETTGLRPSYLEQLYTFGAPDRSKAADDGRVISVVYFALVKSHEAAAAKEGENVRWFDVSQLPPLAFDHHEIVDYALWRLQNKTAYAHVALHFLGERFTLGQLREIYEAILQKKLDPANFRRRVEATGTIVPTQERLTGGRHRPPRLYKTVESNTETGATV
jgi:8-oxo-dGTP diphosphatase